MSTDIDRLYNLLPAVYRLRDADQGWPLRALLQVIAEQVDVVEADIDQLYANWFIETCQEWVAPYIGDLVGFRPVHELGEPEDLSSPQGRLRSKILAPRREVANTIHYRRRKGTLALFELLASQVAGWPAHAVEFYTRLAWAQNVRHLRPERGRTMDLHDGVALDQLGGAFDPFARTVDVRRPQSAFQPGRYNIPSIGLFVWRLKSYPVSCPYSLIAPPVSEPESRTQAYCLERTNAQRYTFSVLGNDTPLYVRPVPEAEHTDVSAGLGLPVPLRRRAFEADKERYYGPGKSVMIWTGFPRKPVSVQSIVVADLSDWERYQPRKDQVAVDPQLGRILFRSRTSSREKVWVAYHYGFSADMGGGEYDRRPSRLPEATLYMVGEDQPHKLIADALRQWHEEQPGRAVIEIADSGVYSEQLSLELAPDQELMICAANRTRPVIRQLDYQPSLSDAFEVKGAPGSSFTLDGVLVTGRPLRVIGPLRQLKLHHVTLVPGWTIHPDGEPDEANEYSLELIDNPGMQVVIGHSILGSIQVDQDQVTTEPVPITLSDSILDATSPLLEALDAPEWPLAHAALAILRSTVIGVIRTHAIDLAENSVFDGQVEVGRSQRGCMRFCYAPPESRTPRRYRCQPDLAAAAAQEEVERRADWDGLSAEDQRALRTEVQEQARLRVRPVLESARYGTPAYARLAGACAEEIRRGASDESEMGAFHDLFEPQRAANLQARLDEYAPAGTDIGIIYAS